MSTRINVSFEGADVYIKAITNGPLRYQQATDGLIKQDINKSKQVASSNAPRKTGNLRDSIKTQRISNMHHMLFVDNRKAPYGIFQEIGTKPYIIRPRRAKVLRFVVDGKPVFSMKVKHPGIKGVFFVKRAVFSVFTGFQDRLKKAHIKVFKRMGGR